MSYKHLLGLPLRHKLEDIEGLEDELLTLLKLDGSRDMTENLNIVKAAGNVTLGTLLSPWAEDTPCLVLHNLTDNQKMRINFSNGYPFDMIFLDADDNMIANPQYFQIDALGDAWMEYDCEGVAFYGDVDIQGDIVSAVNFLQDVGFNGIVSVDTLKEKTPDAGTTIESILMRDGKIWSSDHVITADGLFFVGKDSDGVKPACNLTRRGAQLRIEGSSGNADELWICQKDSKDQYAWVQIA